MIKPQEFFNDRLELESWLKDKPVEWGQVIATRAALRVFPLIIAEGPVLTLGNFRSNFISWAACNYPQYDMGKVSNYAAVANSLDFDLKLSKVPSLILKATTNATFTLAHIPDILPFDTREVYEAVSSAAQVVPDDNLIWRQSNHDATWLELNTNAQGLIRQPLWLAYEGDTSSELKVQKEIIYQLEQSAYHKTAALKNAHLIVDWYRALLPFDPRKKPHSFFGEKADLTIAMQPKEFWERGKDDEGVEAVLADIAKIVDGTYETDPSPTQKNVSQEKVSQETFQPAERTDVKPKSDEPTAEDELGRRPFAESLVDKINEVREARQKDGFAVHLHAPWGAGKTSILLMMQDYMKRSVKKETRDNNWVVVNFNAWEHERRNPPWWPLIEAVERDCSAYLAEEVGIRPKGNFLQVKLDFFKSLVASLFKFKNFRKLFRWKLQKDRWYWWRAKSDWLPYLGALIMFLLLVCLIIFDSEQSGFISTTSKIFTGLSAAVLTFIATTQSMVFGSKENANYYFQLSNDPLGRIKHLFRKLIDGVDRPVCIYIDDLDRCHADFVVDLLEGIQSSFRHEKVTYVVAADKGWIRSAFETRYDSFNDHVGDAAQPIGYLFLEKIFQMSTPIPGMAAYVKQKYFDRLLGDKDAADEVPELPEIMIEKFNNAVADIEKKVPDLSVEKIIQYARENPTEETVAAATKLMDRSPKAEKDAKHLLKDFSSIVSGNPREMKRLLNAFAMRRTISLLQASTVSMDVLFRWTILEQSYPALADELIKQPELVENYHGELKKEDDVTKDLAPFIEIAAVYDIVCFSNRAPLTADHIRDIVYGGKAKEEL